MTLFFIFACFLVVVALAAMLPAALRKNHASDESTGHEFDQLETNISIAKERRNTLRQSLANGAIDQARFDTELSDLENGLAMDISAQKVSGESSSGNVFIAALIALFVPIASGALYLHLGTPNGVDTEAMHLQATAAQQPANEAPPALTELLPNLEKKLEANPDDRDGWKLLGKSYLTIGDFPSAKRALTRAYDLDSDDPDLLAQLAEATAMESEGDLSGEPSEYLDSALAMDPAHKQSLWLKAIATQQAGNHEEAISRFESLRAGVPGNPEALASIDQMMAQSTQALGRTSPEPTNSASITVRVDLSEQVKAATSPTDSVFIFATASNGPPMPLAVSRHTVSELPLSVVLDDSMAMIPDMTLGKFPSVTVGARVSKSGNPIAQPGDWFVEQTEVDVATTQALNLTISQQQP